MQKYTLPILAVFVTLLLCPPNLLATAEQTASTKLQECRDLTARLEKTAAFILSTQDKYGAMNESGFINTDSNMLYAMMGLIRAYDLTNRPEYLRGVEKAAEWLIRVQNREGDWHLAYMRKGLSYVPVLPKSYSRFASIRGVDTTMALFIHVGRELYKRTRDTTLKGKLLVSAKKAYGFLLQHNADKSDGLYWSSLQLPKKWLGTSEHRLIDHRMYKVKYASDNAETYLGLMAAGEWFAGQEGTQIAQRLKERFRVFFAPEAQSFAVMLDKHGDHGMRPAYAYFFANGWSAYLLQDDPMFAVSRQTIAKQMDTSGSFSKDGNVYALSSLAFLLGESGAVSASVSTDRLQQAKAFLLSLQKPNGGIMDDVKSGNTYVNIAGIFLLYLCEEINRIR